MKQLPKSLQQKLQQREANNALRKLPMHNDLVDFASNDYLGFAKNEAVSDLSHQLLINQKLKINVRATGSRLLTGNYNLHTETEFNDDGMIDLIPNSLDEGWDINKFPVINNNSRVGSYNRGFQTQLGGEAVKWLLRASSNINVTDPDCGSRLGIPKVVSNENLDWFIGHSIVGTEKTISIETKEDITRYIGKEVVVRSPMFCTLEKTDYCQACAGRHLSANPEAASMAVSDYGSAFLNLFMAAMHGKELAVAKMNWRELIF